MEPLNVNDLVPSHNVAFLTLDTLRFDVAANAMEEGVTPNLEELVPGGRWESRHTPGSFTYAAHHAFFAGFLPTPATTESSVANERLFAARFPGSLTTSENTLTFDEDTIVAGFFGKGYRTICIGGTGFFNKKSALGSVFPEMFEESWWNPSFGVACRDASKNQVACAVSRLKRLARDQRVFLFVNFSACHPPHHIYLEGAAEDSALSQAAALADIDSHFPPLIAELTRNAPLLLIICSDHGMALGEEGLYGHRVGHPSVWTVPYMHRVLEQGETLNET